jgi:hypothetical protein
MESGTKQSKGGRARAGALTQQERSRIAAEGGRARAGIAAALPKVDYSGSVKIGEAEFPCAVLSDGRRVLSENGITNAILGGRSGASKRLKKASQDSGSVLPLFVAPGQLAPFVTGVSQSPIFQPIRYLSGRRTVSGYDPRVLRVVCEVWVKARDAGALQKQQLDKAATAEKLLEKLIDVGLLALIDEATGYQYVRARDELQKILAAYISPELLPWAKRFPDTFYEHLYRVRGWTYRPGSNARTAYVGKLTKALIYDPLPPGVIDELERKNPYDPEKRRRKHLHHQLLTPGIGHPHLEKQIVSVTTLLRISDDWNDFSRHFTKAFPPGPDDLFALPPPDDDEGPDANS